MSVSDQFPQARHPKRPPEPSRRRGVSKRAAGRRLPAPVIAAHIAAGAAAGPAKAEVSAGPAAPGVPHLPPQCSPKGPRLGGSWEHRHPLPKSSCRGRLQALWDREHIPVLGQGTGGMLRAQDGCWGHRCRRGARDTGGMPEVREGCRRCGKDAGGAGGSC